MEHPLVVWPMAPAKEAVRVEIALWEKGSRTKRCQGSLCPLGP
jgi:hypothetical protein